jgi:hypothetical protein
MPENDVTLVRSGYTVSSPTAAFGRIGELYVMRDNQGHKVALPVPTEPDHLREVWAAFQRAAARNGPMPTTLFGEIVQSGASAGDRPKSAQPLLLQFITPPD